MMKYFRCERGLAMLEAVLATAVVGILISIALPKLSLALDVSYADYEIRCLHSMFHHAQSVGRLFNYRSFCFDKPSDYNGNTVELVILRDNPVHYCVRKQNASERIKEDHYIERRFMIDNGINDSLPFNMDGDLSPAQSGTINLHKGDVSRKLRVTNYNRARIER